MPDLAAAMKATWPHLTELGAVCQLSYDTKISRDILDLYLDGLQPGPRHAERLEEALGVPAHRRAEEGRLRARAGSADADLLREEADELDESWRVAAAHGLRDSIGGEEYLGQSPAPRLRAIADKLEVS